MITATSKHSIKPHQNSPAMKVSNAKQLISLDAICSPVSSTRLAAWPRRSAGPCSVCCVVFVVRVCACAVLLPSVFGPL